MSLFLADVPKSACKSCSRSDAQCKSLWPKGNYFPGPGVINLNSLVSQIVTQKKYGAARDSYLLWHPIAATLLFFFVFLFPHFLSTHVSVAFLNETAQLEVGNVGQVWQLWRRRRGQAWPEKALLLTPNQLLISCSPARVFIYSLSHAVLLDGTHTRAQFSSHRLAASRRSGCQCSRPDNSRRCHITISGLGRGIICVHHITVYKVISYFASRPYIHTWGTMTQGWAVKRW